jgi:hypothetical protein
VRCPQSDPIVPLTLTFELDADVIGKQVRMGDGYFPIMLHKKPPFDLPVIYEDDYFAIGKSRDVRVGPIITVFDRV